MDFFRSACGRSFVARAGRNGREVRRRWSRPEVLWRFEFLREQIGADEFLLLDEARAIRLFWETKLGDACHRQGINNSCEQSEDEVNAKGLQNGFHSLGEVQRDQEEVDQFDADERRD